MRAGVPTHLDSLVTDLLNPDLPLPSAESLAGELASFGQFEDGDLADAGSGGRDNALDFEAFDAASQSTAPPKPAGRKLAVGVVGLLVLALAGTLAAAKVLGDPAAPGDATPPSATSSGAPQQAKPAGQPTVLKIDGSKDRIVSPKGIKDNTEDADKTVDGNQYTAWSTDRYSNKANFGGLKDGMGVWIDLGEPRQIVSVQVDPATGASGSCVRPADRRPGAGPADGQPIQGDRGHRQGRDGSHQPVSGALGADPLPARLDHEAAEGKQ